ncbi:MAG: RNA polymerase sigma factor [Bacillota bacterium]|nr:RNA polymerase sigma factor [Bacillota bacterium]
MNTSAAWARLVEQHGAQLYGLALHTLGNKQDAEDVVQDAFLRAFVALERRRAEIHTSLRAYLCRITLNLCYDRLRSRGRVLTVPPRPPFGFGIDAGAGADEWPAAADPGPDDVAVRSDEARHVRQAVEDLSPNQRSTVVLRYGLDLSYREIAAVLEVPENTVATWLRRAHLALRRRIEKEEGLPCPATARV